MDIRTQALWKFRHLSGSHVLGQVQAIREDNHSRRIRLADNLFNTDLRTSIDIRGTGSTKPIHSR